MRIIRKIAGNIKGATAVEYALILALVFLAMIAGLTNFADGTISMWDGVANSIRSAEDA